MLIILTSNSVGSDRSSSPMMKLSKEKWKAKRADCRMQYLKCWMSSSSASRKLRVSKVLLRSPLKMLNNFRGMFWNSSPNKSWKDYKTNFSISDGPPSRLF